MYNENSVNRHVFVKGIYMKYIQYKLLCERIILEAHKGGGWSHVTGNYVKKKGITETKNVRFILSCELREIMNKLRFKYMYYIQE